MNVQDISPSSLEHRTLSRSLQYMHPYHHNRRLREKRWIYQFSVPSFPIKSPVMWSWLPATAPRWFKCLSCFQKWKSFFGSIHSKSPQDYFLTFVQLIFPGRKRIWLSPSVKLSRKSRRWIFMRDHTYFVRYFWFVGYWKYFLRHRTF